MQRAQRGFQEQLGSGSGLGRVAGKGGREGRPGREAGKGGWDAEVQWSGWGSNGEETTQFGLNFNSAMCVLSCEKLASILSPQGPQFLHA